MSLFDTYKAKELGISTGALNEFLLGKKIQESYVPFVESVPYVLRDTPDNVASKCNDEIVGGTIVWNQLVKNGNFEDSTDWTSSSSSVATVSVADNEAVLTWGNSGNASLRQFLELPLIPNHRYLVTALMKGNPSRQTFFQVGNTYKTFAVTDNYAPYSLVLTPTSLASGSTIYAGYITGDNGDTLSVKNFQLFDLTKMFRTAIANHINSIEASKAGSGYAWFRELFPDSFYEYDGGSFKSVKATSHITRNASGSIIGEYPLDDSLTLMGIPKLDASNNLYYDGDKYESNGNVTRRFKAIDLGSLTWNYSSGSQTMYSYVTSWTDPIADNTDADAIADIICEKYVADTGARVFSKAQDKTISRLNMSGYGGDLLRVYDSGYTDAATFTAAISGTLLLYELATSSLQEAEPYENPQRTHPHGTEEYAVTEQDGVAVPVGHNTEYMIRS